MLLQLSGEVNYAMLDSLVKTLNEAKKRNEKLTIYFSSEGGLSDVAEAIIEIVNKESERILMIFYGEVFSSGMVILLRVQCEKAILKDTRGMFHFAWQSVMINETGKPTDGYDKFSVAEMKRSKEVTLNFLKTTRLTQSEIVKIKKGEDVYFSYTRLLELI